MDATLPPASLTRPIDPTRDHVRGGGEPGAMTLLIYGDFLCPYCRRLRRVLLRLRKALGDRLLFSYRHFPNERVHPGAELLARASEAAALQSQFWDMYDALFDREPPLGLDEVMQIAGEHGLDLDRFRRDLDSPAVHARVAADVADGHLDGVSATPTLFIGGRRYDGAWDYHALLEALRRPVGAQVRQTARAFANLPASAGIVLLVAAAAAILCANTPLAPYYARFVGARFAVGPEGAGLTLPVFEWVSEGLLAVFFLIVGLEIRREVAGGVMASWRTAVLPVVAALGGTIGPAGIYLALNRGATAPGWSVPTATDIAFVLAILAVLGPRAPASLKIFIAAFAVVDDILSMLVLALFYGSAFHPPFLLGAAGALAALALLNAWRVYTPWPYVVMSLALWTSLHLAGVHAALSGVLIAAFLPTWPPPAVSPLLAQTATALSELEQAEETTGDHRQHGGALWDWAIRNLVAATDRLLSPAERVERAVEPWSSYVILPLFAFSAAGIRFAADFGVPDGTRVLAGIVLALVIGKPLGITLACFLAVRARIATTPEGVSWMAFIAAACLCGIGDSFSLLLAGRAFPQADYAAIAKIGVLAGSVISAALGATILLLSRPAKTAVEPSAR